MSDLQFGGLVAFMHSFFSKMALFYAELSMQEDALILSALGLGLTLLTRVHQWMSRYIAFFLCLLFNKREIGHFIVMLGIYYF